MTELPVVPYGAWPTPITSELVISAAVGVAEIAVDGETVWWAEGRPQEAGRTQLVRWDPSTGPVDVLPDDANARTAVHEYGGRAWWVAGGSLWFTNWADQVLRRLGAPDVETAASGGSIEPLAVPVPPAPIGGAVARGDRWADGDVGPEGTPAEGWMLVVRERHVAGGGPTEVLNEIVALPVGAPDGRTGRVVAYGPDFVSNPRFSPDGRRVCWLSWNHPDMPWDGTELHVADWTGRREPVVGKTDDGEDTVGWELVDPELLNRAVVAGRCADGAAGDHGESIFQPRWAADGSLWFVSDRTGWWNLYRWTDGDAHEATVEPMVEMEADIGAPQWVFGQSRYAFLDGGSVVFAYMRDGFDHLAVRAPDGTVTVLDLPFTQYDSVQAQGDRAVFVGASPTSEPAVVRVPASPDGAREEFELLRPPRDLGLDVDRFSTPEPIDFPTSGGRTAHALFYPPTNPDVQGPEDELPPLLVLIHGGPTAAARPMLKLGTQYWTSRGFGVVDVNYGGSVGYGRTYRNQLQGTWGVVDVDDCEAAARWLADEGRVDPGRLCIRGGSAGGYTTLAALAFRDTFAAGASHYGVADLEALAIETHKFESRYLDGLIGRYPEDREVYVERSPIHHVERFDRPLAVFQGLEDEVVPPNQAEMIVEALRERKVPVAYVPFEGEQHGFRNAANIRRALDGELSFYAQIFGFTLPAADEIEPLPVENL